MHKTLIVAFLALALIFPSSVVANPTDLYRPPPCYVEQNAVDDEMNPCSNSSAACTVDGNATIKNPGGPVPIIQPDVSGKVKTVRLNIPLQNAGFAPYTILEIWGTVCTILYAIEELVNQIVTVVTSCGASPGPSNPADFLECVRDGIL